MPEVSRNQIKFFKSARELRRWFERHHESVKELWVGYHKKDTGIASITWPESVDEALCFGWIDGIRKSVDGGSYTSRFTPRRPTSVWSRINIDRATALTAQGLMQPAGLRAFEARKENRSGIYSYEQRGEQLPEPYAGGMNRFPAAAKFFQAQSKSYRKAAAWWVVSAKKEETRLKRLAILIQHSQAGRLIPPWG
jgi:uncharacterized protein YdeI (YjbR/CyaY-like superfamily)